MPTTGKNLDELNRIFARSEEVDREVFAEMRSNILLVSGDHYAKKTARIAQNLRTSGANLSNEQKLRITRNHMHRAARSYVSMVLADGPDTKIGPQRKTEIQDKKDAELNDSVWQDIKRRLKFRRLRRRWARAFVTQGEVCTKIWWNDNAGEFLGYEDKLDEETGEPLLEETGEFEPVMDPATGAPAVDPLTGAPLTQPVLAPVKDESRPVFSGDFEFEEVHGFDLLRESCAQQMYEHGRAWIIRKMVDIQELKRKFPDHAAKIAESQHETYVVFDANKGSYEKTSGQTLVREFYWPRCAEYPEGWYSYGTKEVILAEGPLPGGIFPLVWAGFDEYASTPRGRSILRVARPFQAEVNRATSQVAVAQVSLGDDKVLYQSGTKLAPGALLPGVRGISYQGQPPTILHGRDGSQYAGYAEGQINDMDRALMLNHIGVDSVGGQVDPYALLFKSALNKKNFSEYTESFEDFLVAVTEITLQLAKVFLPDGMLIPAVGVREWVNIEEFRKTSPLSTQITVEPMSDTIESLFGRQLTFQHILQYVGKDLDKRTIGKIIKNLPFGNHEDSFDDLTIDEDIATNEMLAVERGQQVEATRHVDPDYMLKKIESRIKTPEFQFMPEQVQMAYHSLKQQYEQIMAEQQEKLLQAKNEFIPVDGALVTVDMYVPDQTNPNNQAKRAKLPQRSLEWLIKALEGQGASLDKLEGMNAQTMAEIAEMLLNKRGQSQLPPGQAAGGSAQMVG